MDRRSVTLREGDEISLTTGAVRRLHSQSAKRTVYPWYPIAGHREGLRMNDLTTLHSAFVILGYHGGTAHAGEIPGMIRPDGTVVPFRN